MWYSGSGLRAKSDHGKPQKNRMKKLTYVESIDSAIIRTGWHFHINRSIEKVHKEILSYSRLALARVQCSVASHGAQESKALTGNEPSLEVFDDGERSSHRRGGEHANSTQRGPEAWIQRRGLLCSMTST